MTVREPAAEAERLTPASMAASNFEYRTPEHLTSSYT